MGPTDPGAPGLAATDPAVAAGTRVTLTFDQVLDASSVPAPAAFAFWYTVIADDGLTDKSGHAVHTVSVEGAKVVLSLNGQVYPCDTQIEVHYTKPDTNALRNLFGTEAAGFNGTDAKLLRNAREALCGTNWQYRKITVRGDGLVIGSSRELRGDSELPGRAFQVKATPPDGSPRTIEGTGMARIEGDTVSVTMASAVAAGETLTASYRRPRGEAGVMDAAGTQLADFTDLPVENATPVPASVEAVEVASQAGPDGAYTEDETVAAAVTFSAPVRVGTAEGTPTLALIADTAAGDGTIRRAAYASGSGTSRLVFAYRVSEADGSLGAVRVAASGLKLNGGAIVDSAHGTPAVLAFGEAPGVTGVSIAPEPDGRWATGDTVEVTLGFAEPVTVEGAPSVGLALGEDERRAPYLRGSGSDELVFGYTLAEGDGARSAVEVPGDSLDLGDGSIASAGGGLAAALAHQGAALVLEPAPVLPALSVADAQGAEGTTLAFAVRLDTAGESAVTVAYASADGTAVAGADYTAVSGTLSFAPGEVEKTVEVAALEDGAAEGAEAFTLALSNPQGASIADGEATGTVADVKPGVAPLTAAFVDVPAEHDGKTAFSFELRFSEDFPGRLSYKVFKDHALQVTNGRAIGVKRAAPHQNQSWTITVRPWSVEDVTVTLPAATDCAAPGSVCTEAGRKLANTVTARVLGPALVSVADAEAREGVDQEVAFPVTLSRAASGTVTVDYATADGTAVAGEDYTATSGTLTFAVGEREKTVAVAVLDDDHDEGRETFTLVLSNANGAHIADGEAVGTILNADEMPQAWLARFGRTVAEQVLAGVEARLAAPREAGGRAQVAGQALGGADEAALARLEAEALARWLAGTEAEVDGARAPSGPRVLAGSAFALTAAAQDDESAPGAGSAALWGRGGWSRFDGREGELTVDGDVFSAALGADYAFGRWLAGALLTHARSTGSYRGDGGDGTVESTLTGIFPYAGIDLSERLTAWAAAGAGLGGLTLTPAGAHALESDLTLLLGALGARGRLVEPAGGSGFSLAIETDGFWVRTNSAAVPGLAAAEADATRLRLGLDGGYRLALAGSGTLEPRFEIGVRHDGGHAETGYGMDLGGGLAWTDPSLGLSAELSARGLLTLELDSFRDVGLSGSLAWDPDPSSDRGPSMTVTQTLGSSASGGMHALLGRPTLKGLAPDDGGDGLERRRVELRAGYGYAAGDRFTAIPEVGMALEPEQREYRVGWRLVLAEGGPTAFELALEGTRREHANGAADPEHGLGLRVTARW